jgi:hypothetical protein
MSEPMYNYDEESDTLAVIFSPAEKGTGIELTDHIILHINKATQRIVRLTLLDYSILVQQTEYGPRTFPVTGLQDAAEDTRDIVFELLRGPSLQDVLRIAAYTPTGGQIIPTISVQPVMPSLEMS